MTADPKFLGLICPQPQKLAWPAENSSLSEEQPWNAACKLMINQGTSLPKTDENSQQTGTIAKRYFPNPGRPSRTRAEKSGSSFAARAAALI